MNDDILDHFDDFEDRFEQNAKIVAIKYFYFESEARLYAARLKEAGIKCFLSNANTTTVIPLGDGGIGLHVKAEEASHAQNIIKKLDIFNKREKIDQNFRDADHEDIAYERELHLEKSKKFDPAYVLITLFLILIILVFALKASNLTGYF